MGERSEIATSALKAIRDLPRRSNARQEASELRLIAEETLERALNPAGTSTPFDDLKYRLEQASLEKEKITWLASQLAVACSPMVEDGFKADAESVKAVRSAMTNLQRYLSGV